MRILFTPDVLTNQLNRDAPGIAETFDALCDEDVKELSELLSESATIASNGLQFQH